MLTTTIQTADIVRPTGSRAPNGARAVSAIAPVRQVPATQDDVLRLRQQLAVMNSQGSKAPFLAQQLAGAWPSGHGISSEQAAGAYGRQVVIFGDAPAEERRSIIV